MIIVGLLAVALGCLLVGIVLPSTPWLIASLIATGGAGYVLWRARAVLSAGAHSAANGASDDTAVIGPADAALLGAPVTGPPDDTEPPEPRPRRHSRAKAAAAAAVVDAVDESPEVEAEQPEPAPPRRSRRKRAGEAAQQDVAEAPTTVLPLEDIAAVELPVAEPAAAEPAAEPASVEAPPVEQSSAAAGDVWVIDGRPRYHLESCAIIQGQDAEPIPLAQATEDGFMPCSLCEPNAVRAGQS